MSQNSLFLIRTDSIRVGLLGLLLSLVGNFGAVAQSHPERVLVIASVRPFGLLAEEIGGSSVDVAVMVPPGADPHTFEPVPSQILKARRAAVAIVSGSKNDEWILRGVSRERTLRAVEYGGAESGGLVDGLWTDPVVASGLGKALAQRFCTVLPSECGGFMQRAEAVSEKLSGLIEGFSGAVAKKSHASAVLSFHPVWTPLLRRVGLREGGGFEECERGARTWGAIAAAQRLVAEQGIRVLVVEPWSHPVEPIAKQLAVTPLTIDSAGVASSTYTDFIGKSLQGIERAIER